MGQNESLILPVSIVDRRSSDLAGKQTEPLSYSRAKRRGGYREMANTKRSELLSTARGAIHCGFVSKISAGFCSCWRRVDLLRLYL